MKVSDTVSIADFVNGASMVSASALDMAGYSKVKLSSPDILTDQTQPYDTRRAANDTHLREAVAWCAENTPRQYVTDYESFWFDTDEQATMFKLVWG